MKEEVPRIDAALKNFLSLKMAEGLSAADAAGSHTEGALSQQAAMGCARVLLKALNAADLPPAPEWGQRHPQAEDERGVDFMDRLSEYKVVRALWTCCRAAGQKPSRLLGRSALRCAYADVALELLARAPSEAAAAGATEEQLRAFVEDFGRSLAEGPAQDAAADLVWATDVKAAVAARQRARVAEAAEREQRAESAEAFGEELRAALAQQGLPHPQEAGSSVQVEEVAE